VALRALDERPVLPVACSVEAYAVLTRLPPPHRADPRLVRDFLATTFAGPGIGLTEGERGPALIGTLVDLGIGGGASYDAIIALVCPGSRRHSSGDDARADTTPGPTRSGPQAARG
jgi:hypothetical protein